MHVNSIPIDVCLQKYKKKYPQLFAPLDSCSAYTVADVIYKLEYYNILFKYQKENDVFSIEQLPFFKLIDILSLMIMFMNSTNNTTDNYIYTEDMQPLRLKLAANDMAVHTFLRMSKIVGICDDNSYIDNLNLALCFDIDAFLLLIYIISNIFNKYYYRMEEIYGSAK